jgi:hypothetical protein
MQDCNQEDSKTSEEAKAFQQDLEKLQVVEDAKPQTYSALDLYIIEKDSRRIFIYNCGT